MPSEEKAKSDLTLEELQHIMQFLNGTTDIGCEICDSARDKIASMIVEESEKGDVPDWMKKLGVVSIEHVKEGGIDANPK